MTNNPTPGDDATNGEEAFLRTLQTLDGVSPDLGDDCAVLNLTRQTLLATVDSLNESVHFESSVPFEDVARKLVGINVSDVAAMGGRPRWALLAEGSNDDRKRREDFCRTLTDVLADQDLTLVGGDVGSIGADDGRYYSMTLIGEAHPRGILRRDGAEPGDALAVTGSLGGPACLRATSTVPWNEKEREWLYNPPNRVTEGRQLVEAGVRCAIDLSDGLLKDLKRVLTASGVGACLDPTALPAASPVDERSGNAEDRLEWTLTGGEEFELLFTIPNGVSVPVEDYTVIGEVTATNDLTFDPVLPSGFNVPNEGYDHLS